MEVAPEVKKWKVGIPRSRATLKHGYGYLVECPCVRHADMHRIRVGYVSDMPRGISLTK